ncbi:MAG TPA: serine hydrolase domain-containing protein [Dehalococcoidia bacterium]|nr:serine hydrolase domain-containing protein [Dehalococcoidia bacterium]
MTVVQGSVEPGFEALRDVFEGQFGAGLHIGAGVAVCHRGRLVADLWGGLADDDTGAPWTRDTMAVSFSTTKGLTAACLHVLADRGLVRYDDAVSKYWPGFATNGKGAITVYHLLTHQAGIPQVPEGVVLRDLLDWERMTTAVAGLTPLWEAGAATGYHALTFGWLVGEVVRRIDGRLPGTFFAEEIARPLGITGLHIGAPESAEPHIATLKSRFTITPEMQAATAQVMGPDALLGRALGTGLGDMNGLLNTREGHAAQIPAANGVMSARDLARFYACLGAYGELGGVRILSEATVRRMSERQTYRPDRVIMNIEIGWSLGYMNGGAPGWPQGPRVTSFGHAGFGGSLGFADPEIGMSFGLVLNALNLDLVGAGRTSALADAARACAEAAG